MTRFPIFILLLLLLGFSQALLAESPKPPSPQEVLAAYQQKYPGEAGAYLEQRTEVLISLVGGKVQVKILHFYDMLHLNEQSNGYAQEVLQANSFVELSNIEAYSLLPEKSKYKKVKVEQFEEKNNVVGASFVFYDDTKQTRFVFPGARPGARNVLQYEENYLEPRFLRPWYLSNSLPVEKASLKITVDPQVHIRFKDFNLEQLNLNFKEIQEGGKKVYHWSAQNMAGMRHFDDNAPAAPHFLPHLVYWIERVDAPLQAQRADAPAQLEVPYLAGTKELYTFYSTFVKDLKPGGSPALKATVDSLVHNAGSEEEKVRRILYWVQDHVKYIAFEDGMRGFVPHEATKVYNNRYGDCKDMSSITWTMMHLAGIKGAHLAWIGTRRLPYRYADVPTPIVDNHMIAVYKGKQGYIFLDGTSQHTQFGMPSSMIQGKEALVGLGEGQFEVVPVPVVPAENNLHFDSLHLKLEQNKLQGSGTVKMQGYPKTYATYSLEGTNKQQEKDKINKMLNKGHNKFFVQDYKIDKLYQRDAPLEISYSCSLEDYHRALGQDIYVNLHLERDYENSRIELAKRRQDMEREYRYNEKQVVVMEVPAGYQVTYLPANQEFNHPLFGFNFAYRQQGNKIVLEKTIRMNHLLLGKADFAKWNEMVASLQEAYREVVILTK